VKKIRVLVVDDSVVIRKLVSDGLAQDEMVEICGIAANGRIAMQKIPQCNPDIVTLDIEMPEMDGLQTIKEIRKLYPRLPVIMFSTLTERGATATLEALSLGASDYVTKPANVGSVAVGTKRIQEDLLPKIRSLCGVHPALVPTAMAATPAMTKPATAPAARVPGRQAIEILAIGCSTGGPNALADVIPELPADLPVPVVIVQHMPPLFTKMLAERLHSKSKIKVFEGQPGMVLQPGTAYLAPGDYHMVLQRKGVQTLLALNQEPPENSCRPAVDVLFRSVAALYGGATLGVILTGMGQDGLRGCELLRDAGAQILAQDEASSVVWGMPGFVAKAGLADRVLPLSLIGQEMARRICQAKPAAPKVAV
jgi:two-component system, chemotaxis family, protein-glutamate methylesterase/glutaminase